MRSTPRNTEVLGYNYDGVDSDDDEEEDDDDDDDEEMKR